MAARALFIGGTSSNAGKSWMATAICASLRRRGISVAPFKAQNMSNNSFPCRDGGEIGRAQVAQAEACGLEPDTAMNPILLKPNGDGTSQVVVRGRVWKTLRAREYYAQFDALMEVVLDAYRELSQRFDAVVIEGAGSVSELNLRPHDLVNLGLVTRVGAPWVLVADIDRGGVFASVIGTASLLTPDERRLFRGFLVNRFRGDLTLFDEGARTIEERIGAPCLGVFPYADGLRVDAEDSLALDVRRRSEPPEGARIAIVHLPRISNATDFRLLTWADWLTEPPGGAGRAGEKAGGVGSSGSDVAGGRGTGGGSGDSAGSSGGSGVRGGRGGRGSDYDFIILPGSKHTACDLDWLRDRGFEGWIHEQHRRGATILGICGGFQMLGRAIADPQSVESADARTVQGLGLLPVDTVLTSAKTTRQRRAALTNAPGVTFAAYEIHLGVTTFHGVDLGADSGAGANANAGANADAADENGGLGCGPTRVGFATLDDGSVEGIRAGRVIGTYLHGAFEHAAVCSAVFGVPVQDVPSKAQEYDRLADWFEQHCRRPDEWLPLTSETRAAAP